jgi:NitT/TauT family transport system permease protein
MANEGAAGRAVSRVTRGAVDDVKRVAQRSRATRRQFLAWGSVLVGLALWEIAGRLVGNPLFLATPSQTVGALAELWSSGELQHHIWVSGQEFILGFALASVLGIAIGLATASSETFKTLSDPWVSGLYATPIIAIAPLFILWFGIGVFSKMLVVFSLVIFPVIINTDTGIRTADRQLVEAVRSFGASRRQIFVKVLLPSALPFILAGLRLGVGRGLIGVVVGEIFGSRAGLGYLIIQSAEVFNMPRLFSGVMVLAATGILLTAAFQMLERRLVRWNYE